MSRSRKKRLYSGNTCAESEKEDKQRANRTFRRKVRQQIVDQVEDPIFNLKETSDVWDFAKDGKKWIGRWPDLEKHRRK